MRSNTEHFMANNGKNEALNRLRVVLAEQEKTNRWLAVQLGKTEHTFSRWCHNKSQPSVAQLNEIANVLHVDVRTLMTSNIICNRGVRNSVIDNMNNKEPGYVYILTNPSFREDWLKIGRRS